MLSSLLTENAFIWRCVWQTTVCLVAGGLLSFLWMRRPARAHRLLLLAMVAALATPLLSQAVQQLGWGVLRTPPPVIELGVEGVATFVPENPVLPQPDSSVSLSPTAPEQTVPATQSSPSTVTLAQTESRVHRAVSLVPWTSLLLWGWLALSGLCMVRLLVSLAEGARMVSRARPVTDEALKDRVESVASELGLRRPPDVFLSKDARCPQIWCWRGRPALLLPDSGEYLAHSSALRSVLCHELSHLKRHDHFAVLLSELLICLLPWQPLAWWSKRRLVRLSEQSCDDWALARGSSPAAYAELVLSLLPQSRPSLALTAVTSRSGLQGRIHHILRRGSRNPRAGHAWTLAAMVLAVCLAGGIAFAQKSLTTIPALSAAGAISSVDSQAEKPMPMSVQRRIDIPDNLKVSNLSPDGKYFACFSRTRSLLLFNTHTGEIEEKVDDFAWPERALWSSDGNRLAYIKSDTSLKSFKLCIADLSTSEKTDAMDLEDYYFHLEDWSPDGRHILGVEDPGNRKQDKHVILLVDLESKQIQPIDSEDDLPRSFLNARFSPDGRLITYRTGIPISLFEDQHSTLHIRSLDGVHRESLKAFAGGIDSPHWSPDGEHILFRGAHNGRYDLWAVKVEDGLFVGMPFRAISGFGYATIHSYTSQNYFAYSQGGGQKYCVYVLPIDQETCEVRGLPTDLYGDGTPVHAWAPDGKTILQPYIAEMRIIDLNSKLVRMVKPIFKGTNGRGALFWPPDGSTAIAVGEVGGRVGLFKVSLETGEMEYLPIPGITSVQHFTREKVSASADGKKVALDYNNEIRILTLPTRESVTVAKSEKENIFLGLPSISADGRDVLYWRFDWSDRSGEMLITSIETNETRILRRFPKGTPRIIDLDWSPNGKYVVYSSVDNRLMALPLSGEPEFRIPLPDNLQINWYSCVRWSPTGDHLSFAATQLAEKSQYWIVDNFTVGEKEEEKRDAPPLTLPKTLKGADVELVGVPDKAKYEAYEKATTEFYRTELPEYLKYLREPTETYSIVRDGLRSGAMPFTDRTYKLTHVPEKLEGLSLLQTTMGHGQVWKKDFDLALSAKDPVRVFVAISQFVIDLNWDSTGMPEWLKGFQPTGDSIATDVPAYEEGVKYAVFCKEFEPGEIHLGPSRGRMDMMYFAFFGVEAEE